MITWTVNKSKLHRLVSERVPELPAVSKTEFDKLRGKPSYFLRWIGGEAYLAPCAGTARLRIKGFSKEDVWYSFTIEELLEAGILSNKGQTA